MYALKKEIFQKKRSTARTWSHGASLCGSGGPYHHVVDLDGALAGKSENLSAIKAILREGGISIEVGGGIRTYEQIEGLLSLGVSQVILALPPSMIPSLWKRANRDFPHKIVVASMPKMAMQPLMDGKKTAISRPRHLLGVSPRRGRRESSYGHQP